MGNGFMTEDGSKVGGTRPVFRIRRRHNGTSRQRHLNRWDVMTGNRKPRNKKGDQACGGQKSAKKKLAEVVAVTMNPYKKPSWRPKRPSWEVKGDFRMGEFPKKKELGPVFRGHSRTRRRKLNHALKKEKNLEAPFPEWGNCPGKTRREERKHQTTQHRHRRQPPPHVKPVGKKKNKETAVKVR